MLGDFVSAEFQELADDLFQDGINAVLRHARSTKYDPVTLTTSRVYDVTPNIKLIWVSPQQSTQIEFESEIQLEDATEHKVASILFRGEVKTADELEVTGFGKFVVTGVVRIAPLGPTIYHRVKLSR